MEGDDALSANSATSEEVCDLEAVEKTESRGAGAIVPNELVDLRMSGGRSLVIVMSPSEKLVARCVRGSGEAGVTNVGGDLTCRSDVGLPSSACAIPDAEIEPPMEAPRTAP